MAIYAPAFLMKQSYLRKRTRDLWGFWYLITRGSTFVGRWKGFRLLFDLDNVVDRYLLAFGFYEQESCTTLFKAAEEAAAGGGERVFLDIGAHWGFYALSAHATGLFTRIVAVEADPRNTAQLQANLFLNDLTGAVTVTAAAAAGEPGRLTFSLADRLSRVVSKVSSLETKAGREEISVPAVRLDDIEPQRGGVVVIKIDVEGFEGEVIRGMRALLTGNRGILQVEVFQQHLAAFDETMTGLGYARFAEVGVDRYYRNH